MSWIKIVLQIVLMLVGYFFTSDKDKKAEKKKTLKDIEEAFKSKDKDSIHRIICKTRRRY